MNKALRIIEISVLSLLFIGAVLFAYSAKADRFNIETIPELIEFDSIPQEEFEKKTKFIEFVSPNDPNINHSFFLPKEWSDNVAFVDVDSNRRISNKKVLATVARYNSPPDEQYAPSYFTVEAMELEYEIGVKNWFINYVLANGLSLQGMTVSKESERQLEAVYVEIQKDITYIVRTKAFINGTKVIVARYYVPYDLFSEKKLFQAQIVDSFSLNNLDDRSIEELQTHGFLNQAYFDYPPSWQIIAQPVISIDEMKAMLHRNSVLDRLDGQINIKVYSKLSTSTRKGVIAKFRDDFNIPNYEVGKLIEEIEAEYHKDMSSGSTQLYQLNPTMANMINYELWVSILENDEYIFLATLVTPSREEEFYTWARNGETFRLVVKSMRGDIENQTIYQYLE